MTSWPSWIIGKIQKKWMNYGECSIAFAESLKTAENQIHNSSAKKVCQFFQNANESKRMRKRELNKIT